MRIDGVEQLGRRVGDAEPGGRARPRRRRGGVEQQRRDGGRAAGSGRSPSAGSSGAASRVMAGDRQVDRRDEVLAGPVVVDALADREPLGALHDQREHGARSSTPAARRRASAAESSTPSIAVVSSGRAWRAISAARARSSPRAGTYIPIAMVQSGWTASSTPDRAGSCIRPASSVLTLAAVRWFARRITRRRPKHTKIAIVTGASSGIGQAAALRIAERGVGVIAHLQRQPRRGRGDGRGHRGARRRGRRPPARRRRQRRRFDAFAEQVAGELAEPLAARLFDHLVNNAGFGADGACSRTRPRSSTTASTASC